MNFMVWKGQKLSFKYSKYLANSNVMQIAVACLQNWLDIAVCWYDVEEPYNLVPKKVLSKEVLVNEISPKV